MRSSRVHTVVTYLVLVIPLLATLWGGWELLNGRVSWFHIGLLILFYGWTEFGVTIGYHRYLTHGGFKTYPWMETVLLLGASFSWQGGPLKWVANHRKHHEKSDKKGEDPHTPLEGYWHAHFGWLLQPRVVDYQKYAPDLLRNRQVMWIAHRFALWSVCSLVFPFIISAVYGFFQGGFSYALEVGLVGFIWGGLIRICLVHHSTWSVNSICHTKGYFSRFGWLRGYRGYHTRERSLNVWWLWLVTGGESFHHNHHKYPYSAFHGLRWFEWDPSGWLILFMEITHIISEVKRPRKSDSRLEPEPEPIAA